MVARFPAQISKLPARLPAAGRRSTSDLTFQPADALSAFDSALLPRAEARGAHSVALSPLDSALTDCCLSYKQNAAVSPLESTLTNASHLLDSTCFETACFDTLAQTSPASPLESALTKTPGGGGIPTRPRLQRPASSIEPPEPNAPRGASISCGLSRLRILPVTTWVYPPSFPTTDFETFKRANSFACKGLPPLCTLFRTRCLCFHRLQPLSTKHPGYGVRFSLPPLATRHKAR